MAASLSQDEIEAGLAKKGFRRSQTDHRYFTLYVDGKKEAATFLSHGKNQDIGSPLLNAMAKELGLNTKDFIDLVKCPFSTEELMAAKKERLANNMPALIESQSSFFLEIAFQPSRHPALAPPAYALSPACTRAGTQERARLSRSRLMPLSSISPLSLYNPRRIP